MLIRFFRVYAHRLLAATLVFLLFSLVFSTAFGEGTDIVLTFTGDCTLGSEDRLKDKPDSFYQFIKEYGFEYPFANMKDLFSKDDVTVINLENVFTDSANSKAKKTYNFRSPQEFARILPEGSVELAFLGNNHILDYGKQGLQSTIMSLENEGVSWCANIQEATSSYIYEKNGIKIGFAGSYISYWTVNADKLNKTFNDLREAGCDAIVGIMHGGVEYSSFHDRLQERMANWMVRHGANMVIGHHPHVVQGVELIGEASVVYSLGNFSFGGNAQLRATKAFIAQVTLRFGEDKTYLGHQLNLIPVCPSGTLEYNNYQPVFLFGEDASKTIALAQRDTKFPLEPYVDGIGALQLFVPAMEKAPLSPDPQAVTSPAPQK